ncbi:MAG: hypothetical protein AAF349_21990, partial [Cyanobacteria bacterium P01_A01_bin.68]
NIIIFILLSPDSHILQNLLGSLGIGEDNRYLESDTSERLGLWLTGLDNWLEGNAFQVIFGRGFRSSLSNSGIFWKTPHNLYIAMLGDFGIFGLLMFVFPLFYIVWQTSFKICKIKNTGIESFTFVSLLGLIIHNFTEVFFYSPVMISLALIIVTFYTQDYKWKKLNYFT